jgi:hypothetical protein
MITLFLLTMFVPCVRAQSNSDEYTRQVGLARGYMDEARYDEALDALNKAYEAKPESEALALMGYVFLLEGKSTEALDVFNQVLSQGGTIALPFQHIHGIAGSCRGTLNVSAAKVSWVSTNQKENFETTAADIQKASTSEYANSNGDGSVSTFLQFHANGKNWKVIYLLHGPAAKYQIAGDLWFRVVYAGTDLDNARKASALLARLIGSAASVKVNPPAGPGAKASSNTTAPATAPTATTTSQTSSPSAAAPAAPVEIKEGQTPQEVQNMLGKPDDTITVKDTLVYIYPTVKVYFEKGKLVNVEERK